MRPLISSLSHYGWIIVDSWWILQSMNSKQITHLVVGRARMATNCHCYFSIKGVSKSKLDFFPSQLFYSEPVSPKCPRTPFLLWNQEVTVLGILSCHSFWETSPSTSQAALEWKNPFGCVWISFSYSFDIFSSKNDILPRILISGLSWQIITWR